MIATLVALAAGTLLSEDVTVVLAGVLIAQSAISPVLGVVACALGIFVGDLLLFTVGRVVGSRALTWRWVSRAMTPAAFAELQRQATRNLGSMVVGSRFLPGTRLPLYVAAGVLRCPTSIFAGWSAVAVALWTPAVVMASATAVPGSPGLSSWPARVIAAAVGVVVCRSAYRLAVSRIARARATALVARIWRWEFWPMWIFYAPVALWVIALIIRHRGVGVIAAANPGIADGGIVGESKYDILTKLPANWTIPAVRIAPGTSGERASQVADALRKRGWAFPVILKPDVGQRGTGVKLVRSLEAVQQYFDREAGAVVVQPYHDGPHEAGVFYYRMPSWQRGRILSITDKHFPFVVGDGRSTLEELVWGHRRLRMQAHTFLSRHHDQRHRIPSTGERVSLAIAGNHCQGTLFRDGHHLITPALEERIDAIARSYPGFFIGRFDIRYSDVERFKAGEDLAIVELNGATAESTNIYDPDRSLFAAYRQLCLQWWLVFAIGAENRASGTPAASIGRLVHLLRAHVNAVPAFDTSD